MMDTTGLIYLRARYYDPNVSRFIQIDNNYSGDRESVASQNRYVYTMNNPYKYVDRDGNKSWIPMGLLNPNETVGKGYISSKLIFDSIYMSSFERTLRNIKLPDKYFSHARWYYVNRQGLSRYNIVKIKLTANYVPKSTNSNGGSTTGNGGTTTNKPGNSNITNTGSNTTSNIKPKPTPPKKRIEICPDKWSLENWKDFIVNAFNWGKMFDDFGKIFSAGFKVVDSGMITNYAKEHVILGVPMNIKGVKDTVKKLSGLASGTRQTLGQCIKTTFGAQMKLAFTGKGLLGFFIVVGIDVGAAFCKMVVGLINFVRFLIDSAVSLVYAFIQTAAVTAIKAIFTPFMGPFAWLFAAVLDIGLTFIEWFFDLKEKIGDFMEWIIGSNYNNAVKMMNAVKKG